MDRQEALEDIQLRQDDFKSMCQNLKARCTCMHFDQFNILYSKQYHLQDDFKSMC